MLNIIISILSGVVITLILYYLFYSTTVYRGPDSNVIRNQIFKDNGKCYKLEPVVHICPIHLSMKQK